MTMVSSRHYRGYRIDAVWEHSWDEPERYTLTVTAPDGSELGEWDSRENEGRTLDFGEAQADADLYRAEGEEE